MSFRIALPMCCSWWRRDILFAGIAKMRSSWVFCVRSAVLTAYVRGFGGSAGLPQDFCGPMAKQQRMATLTFACILSAAEASLRFEHRFMLLALAIIFGGSLFTAGRRTKRIVQLLNAR